MEKEDGNKSFPIWLLGDSNPKQWEEILEYPLDPRHPIRHNIWTSILDYIQDRVYKRSGRRVDSSSIYIRNAVENPDIKPRVNHLGWNKDVDFEIIGFREILKEYNPSILFTFGAFAYEFARRSLDQEPVRSYSYWSAKKLGEEFRQRIEPFNRFKPNLLPLLHRVVSGGKFVESQDYFCNEEGANYFQYVGYQIADLFIENDSDLDIWID